MAAENQKFTLGQKVRVSVNHQYYSEHARFDFFVNGMHFEPDGSINYSIGETLGVEESDGWEEADLEAVSGDHAVEAGDKIRVQHYCMGIPAGTEDHVVEEFRHCLGFFPSEEHRAAQRFTPLCEMYERGPESESKYMPHFGEYYTNPVQSWMDI